MQEQLPRSSYRGANFCPYIPYMRRSLPSMASRHTPTMDGGSAEIAGANFCPYILYMRRSLPSMAPRHTVHPVHKKGRAPKCSTKHKLAGVSYLLVNSGYASRPHSPISTPSYSSSADTRMPIVILSRNHTILLVINTQPKMVAAPIN